MRPLRVTNRRRQVAHYRRVWRVARDRRRGPAGYLIPADFVAGLLAATGRVRPDSGFLFGPLGEHDAGDFEAWLDDDPEDWPPAADNTLEAMHKRVAESAAFCAGQKTSSTVAGDYDELRRLMAVQSAEATRRDFSPEGHARFRSASEAVSAWLDADWAARHGD